MSAREQKRADYRHFRVIPTRWMDNDIYGHVNNVNYYSYFDTAVNQYLIERGVLDIHQGGTVGFVVETSCSYFRPLAFPDAVAAGIRVARIGNSSIRYEVGLFRNDDEEIAAAGHFVHVYVDRASGKPVAVPEAMRAALAAIAV
ncbi:acyl-CoA thioesterase [Azospira restricta]|uniref:Acyl-CoA thioesterase n=1 Tax=Azospira restricta TaxID=404405 RepID=A0A974SMA6_9RHOO|nr:thioesterase family protein [Azospira restricta]QRJ62470.1 acyl-CoA thioesterase [Azospira restricta]